MVGVDGVPLHFQLFPKLWLDIYNSKNIEEKVIPTDFCDCVERLYQLTAELVYAPRVRHCYCNYSAICVQNYNYSFGGFLLQVLTGSINLLLDSSALLEYVDAVLLDEESIHVDLVK